MARKTREEALVTRGAILDAAETVFQERGVSQTSLAEIAAAAGVTRGAVYWHFANKIDLFDAMVQRVIGLMDAKFEELQNRRHRGDPIEPVREMALYFLDRVANDPRVCRIVGISWHKSEYVGEIARIRDEHFVHGSSFLDFNIAAFQASQKLGFLSPRVNPRAAAIGLRAMVDGLIFDWMLNKTTFPLVETGVEIIDGYLSGLRSPPPKA
ncbi:MAG: TetR family transcriptional regulator [Candidatus Accumulibacter sp.]|jgi:TetR/AcrR family acrAB operon transcriptional repressor|nr:TetR family transcriptional regulator [Accumulibacter sp.]